MIEWTDLSKKKKKKAGEFKQYSIELFQNKSSVIHLRTIILKLNPTEHLGQNHQRLQ